MEKLGEIISRLMMQEGYQRRARQGPIFERWLEVVGDLLAEKSRPLLIRKGVLVVQVTDSVWMHELQMQKGVILDKIRELVGEGEVVDVRWTIWGDAPMRRPRQKGSRTTAIAPSRSLTIEEKAWVQAVAAQVEDADLQEQLRRLLTKYMQNQQSD